jgi:hypothetical protein
LKRAKRRTFVIERLPHIDPDAGGPVPVPNLPLKEPRMKRLIVAALILAASPAFAQAPAPSPSPDGWTATLYAGTATVATVGERREFITARLGVSGPLGGHVSAFLRADATGDQDGGSVATTDPRSFRALEANAGLSYRVTKNLDLAAIAGATFSIEGASGAPIDPRLYTAAGLAKVPLSRGRGYAGAGGGWYGPVGGYAGLVSASIPIGNIGAFTVVDYALPIQAPTGRRPWLLKVGATVRVKTINLGQVVGR